MSCDVVTWGAVIAAIGALGTIVTFWTRSSDRITKAEARAFKAIDELAEFKRTSEAATSEAKREAQEAAAEARALAAKLYQVEIWSRDEFVRKTSFESVVTRMERGFGDLKQDISSRLDRMTDRIEAIKTGGHP
ncbi:hypothetical protein JQ604_25915 [Bradyrhizobium jicamae]|uniref:hypothetical protein n=1 Tax=Bradyrhizobium jicamae TaxID=280332 RepID=UPI001BA80E2D|nr:hypothetical protein [Bradyrhizobium jicamae]MBR0755630.1 hypothetical protein [Bradyrhizobium jicamae]